MLKFSVVCLYFTVVAVDFWNVNCTTEEEKAAIVEALKPIAMKCASDCGLSEEDIKKYNNGDGVDPCFKKCFAVRLGLVDENGKYNRDTVLESISEFIENEDKAKKIQEKLDSCFDANGDNAGDDDESQIKRVDVLFKCLKEIKE